MFFAGFLLLQEIWPEHEDPAQGTGECFMSQHGLQEPASVAQGARGPEMYRCPQATAPPGLTGILGHRASLCPLQGPREGPDSCALQATAILSSNAATKLLPPSGTPAPPAPRPATLSRCPRRALRTAGTRLVASAPPSCALPGPSVLAQGPCSANTSRTETGCGCGLLS